MSNKTPKANNLRRIGLELKYWRPLAAGLAAVILFFAWGKVATAPSNHLSIKGKSFIAEYADTPAQQEKGLGGRDTLAADHAMLFRFQNPGKQCFWMKDMRFNLDIIWLGADKTVEHIEQNLSPSTYPRTYCADHTQYVFEVNAGVTQQLNLHNGDRVDF